MTGHDSSSSGMDVMNFPRLHRRGRAPAVVVGQPAIGPIIVDPDHQPSSAKEERWQSYDELIAVAEVQMANRLTRPVSPPMYEFPIPQQPVYGQVSSFHHIIILA